MADDLSTVGTETPATSPGDAALATLAKDESADAYIRERQSQEAEEQEPESPNGADRSNKIEAALEEARARSRQAREQEQQLDQGLEAAEREWQQQEQQEQAAQQQYANQLAYHEARGVCMARADLLKRTNPTLHKTISENLMMLSEVLSDEQNAVLERALVYYTPAIWKLAENLSNDDVKVPGGETMADKFDLLRRAEPQKLWEEIVKGAQNFQQEQYVQQRILQDRIENGRRMTKAPPPFRMPNGAANPPKDLYREANKGDASDYIRMRRAMDARAEKE
jgi:hypothetical protein